MSEILLLVGGPTRVFALLGIGIGQQAAYLVAVDTADRVRWTLIGDNSESRWAMDAPASDATGNLFVTYNPGRYDGVIVLHPTASGFAPFGAGYADGPLRHYYAELQGPGASGSTRSSSRTTTATRRARGGTVTSTTRRWNGSDYVG